MMLGVFLFIFGLYEVYLRVYWLASILLVLGIIGVFIGIGVIRDKIKRVPAHE